MRLLSSWSGVFGIAAALALSGMAVAPLLACAASSGPASSSASQGDEASAEAEASDMASETEAYRGVLSRYRQLAQTWREAPEKDDALLGASAALREDLESLARLAGEPTEASAPAKTATVESSGPVTASAEPSSEEAAAARERATDRWMTRQLPEAAPEEPTLAGVSHERIRESCKLANQQLTELETLWRAETLDRAAVEGALKALEATLLDLPGPPAQD